jgi:hypothetical protein
MFIGVKYEFRICAPAERDVSSNEQASAQRFAPMERGEFVGAFLL